MLLTSRKLLQRKLLDVECDLRGTLRNFGLKVGVVSYGKIESARIRAVVLAFPGSPWSSSQYLPSGGSCGSNLPSSTKCFSTQSAMIRFVAVRCSPHPELA